jgi:site-specific DNA-methyltransferase (adenine-specific)
LDNSVTLDMVRDVVDAKPRRLMDSDPLRVGKHAIYRGDCLKVMSKMEHRSIDVVVTSPPYNLNISYNTYQDDLTERHYIKWMMDVSSQISRVMKEDGSFFLNVSGSNSQPWAPFILITELRKMFVLQNHITWIKSITTNMDSTGHFKPVSGERFLHHNHEHIFHLTLRGDVKLDRLSIGIPFKDKTNIGRWGHSRDVRCRGNTWFIPYKTVKSRAQKYNHPGTFPVALPLWCINLHGRRNSTVLDPFAGTGTTLVAAHDAGASGIGVEMDAVYARLAYDRLREHIEESMLVILDPSEISELLKQSPSTASDGGWQSLLVGLQNKLNKTTGQINLTRQDSDRIHAYAFKYRDGGWEGRLKKVFGRVLGPDLNQWVAD